MQRQESVLTLKKGTYDYAAEVKGKRIRKPWINGQSWHEICIWNEKYYCKEQKVLLDFFFVQKIRFLSRPKHTDHFHIEWKLTHLMMERSSVSDIHVSSLQ